ncbi:MAG: HAD family hydrolase [Candidatus Njordarchaeia archaeon]
MLRAVIFDMGGVLAKICWDDKLIADITEEALKSRGIKLPQNFKQVYREELYKAWLRIRASLKEESFADVIKLTLDKLNVKYSKDDIDYAFQKLEEGVFCHVDEGVEEVLRRLKSMGLKIGLVSNAPGNFPINVLRRHGLDRYMDAMVTSYMVGVVKPHPKIFKEILSKLGVKPEEAIFVGDVPEIDIKGAKNLGMKAILVKDGDPVMKERGMHKIPNDLKLDYTIDSLNELIDIIKKEIDGTIK